MTTVEVEAMCLEDAKSIGLCAVADTDTRWVEGDVVEETAKAKVING